MAPESLLTPSSFLTLPPLCVRHKCSQLLPLFFMDLNAQLRKEEEAFGDARQIMDDFTKFLRNGGLDVVGANAYDRQQCHDKYESLEVMLQAREYELDNRATSYYGGNPSPESVELNLAILQDIILNAVYFMVPSNETRRVMNSGKLNLLYSRDPSTPYDRRYHNQLNGRLRISFNRNIPQWLNSLPR
ncbi:hypothetical protein AGABI2DRAFT_145743 [Agaricus bisporus var. bisporus H97]|uniref:hypothetical protein n=1 Tax=Agaricus bisporus var. bisporus (strain H97 / ATCC MYA-4626 / FGSC 10389) TaxID=936046 RepID=UPI00029F7D0D|nr:hypothetical protein AGABI2DRAFT_145743 [Agaricus bisporus var. bisporus H97]EKV43457.1 hypothetical protein AGABI2DRAFT_145743 [Agaricus bisporus var. bisporus H97]